jgi:hypothetical protein
MADTMSDQADQKKKKDKKNKNNLSPNGFNSNPYQTESAADKKKIQELEEQINILESRFRLLEDMVPKELQSMSERVTAIGKWVDYDKGEKS